MSRIRYECREYGQIVGIEEARNGFEHAGCDYGMIDNNTYSAIFQKVVDETLGDIAFHEAERDALKGRALEVMWLEHRVTRAK